MKAKKIIIIMMALTLALGVVGCGKDKEDTSTSTSTATQEESKDSKIIEQNEKNLFELGAKQTKEIKPILEKYGVKVNFDSEETADTVVYVSKDESECSASDATGYTVSTTDDVKPNDGGDNNYNIKYGSYITKEKKPYYAYEITIDYTNERVFKLDEFKMFKDLVQAHFGDDYDVASLDTFIQDHIKAIDAGEKTVSSGRDTGSYREGLMGGEKGSDGKRQLIYRLTLLKE